MPNQILQVDENMLETKLDRLVSEKVEQLLNAMLDAEADEITGACRRSYTLECKTNAARRALEGEPLARVARDAGCTPTSVYQWMRRYRSEGILGLMDRRNAPMPAEPMPAAGDDVEELRRQVEVLRLENAVMRETIDVLKADAPRLDPSMLTNRERTRVVDAIRGIRPGGLSEGRGAETQHLLLRARRDRRGRQVRRAAGPRRRPVRAGWARMGIPDHPPHAAP